MIEKNNIKLSNTNNSTANNELLLIRLNQLCQLTTLKPSTIFKSIKNGNLPKPIKLLGVNVWDKQEILNWINSQRQ